MLISIFMIGSMVLNGLSIRYDKEGLQVLNQQVLPQKEEWIAVHSPEEMVKMILELKVRGAPLIGVSAVLTLAQMAEHGHSLAEIHSAAQMLQQSRPTAVNLAHCIQRILEAKDESSVIRIAEQIFLEDAALCNSMARLGADLIQQEENILTYCNTGGLATAGV